MTIDKNIENGYPMNSQAALRNLNLQNFIESAKRSFIELNSSFEWNDWHWKKYGQFTKLDNTSSGGVQKSTPASHLFDIEFLDFAKAYLYKTHSSNSSEDSTWNRTRMSALRLLEKALLEVHAQASPTLIDFEVLNRCVSLAQQRYIGQGPPSYGQRLEEVARSAANCGIVSSVIGTWLSPLLRPLDMGSTIGSAGEKARNAKLPDQRAIEAIAEIFNQKLDPRDQSHHRDIYTTSVTCLLISAPSRAGEEVHHLPIDLVFRATDQFGQEQFGLRWEGGKGFGSYVKWAWEGMVPSLEIALNRLKEITESARELARWMENPITANTFYPHNSCPLVSGDSPLSVSQVCEALGIKNRFPVKTLKRLGITPIDGKNTLDSLWQNFVLKNRAIAHPHFPYVNAAEASKGKNGLKFSEALFCMHPNQLKTCKLSWPTGLWMPSLGSVYSKELTGNPRKNHTLNIFERHGYFDESGRSLSLRSHSLRHMLNTEAQRGKMTNEQIAWWSGRTSVIQNQTYNHMTEHERVQRARISLGGDDKVTHIIPWDPREKVETSTNSIWQVHAPFPPISEGRAIVQPRLAGINTLYGRCEHDYALSPCEGFAQCLDCHDHACIKGDDSTAQENINRIKNLLRIVEEELVEAKSRIKEMDWGAE